MLTMTSPTTRFSYLLFHWQRFAARLHRARVAFHSRGLRGVLLGRIVSQANEPPSSAPVSITNLTASEDGGKLLWIDAAPPQPDRDSGSMRAFNTMRLLREMGYAVEFRSERKVDRNDRAIALLSTLGIPIHAESGRYPRTFLEKADGYTAVIVCRYLIAEYWLPLLRAKTPSTKIIFDTVDLHHLRESREANLRGNRRLLQLAESTKTRELKSICMADTTWVVSTAEQNYLAEHTPAAHIQIVSNVHDIEPKIKGFSGRKDFLFVGSAQHPPNVDAARWIVGGLFQCIRNHIPEAQLHMVGAGLESATRDLPATDGIIWHGRIESLDPLLSSCRAGIAPLRFGAGVKGKITQGMAHGLPMITTSCGAEGMRLTNGHDILVADSDDDFAYSAARLHDNESLWNTISRNGLDNVRRNFSPDAAMPAIKSSLAFTSKRHISRDC